MEKVNRKLLKENGRNALKNNFWIAMLVVLVGSFLGAEWSGLLNNGAGSGINSGSSISSGNSSNYQYDDSYSKGLEEVLEAFEDEINEYSTGDEFHYDYNEELDVEDTVNSFINELKAHYNLTDEMLAQVVCYGIAAVFIIFLLIYVLAVCIQFLIGSFLSAPVGVGYRYFFMKNRQGNGEFKDLFYAFSDGRYMKIVKGMFAANIRMFGWSLLFYFPGLVKYYQYFFVSYIMAENPDISKERARELSERMTDGHKWEIFVMRLSFLGWYFLWVLIEMVLALISCGLLAIPGIVLMFPIAGYQAASFAELYEERREYALMTGMASSYELKGF